MCRLFGISYAPGKRESVSTAVIAAALFGHLTKGGPHAYGWFVSDGADVWYQKHFGRADTASALKKVMSYADEEHGPKEEDVRFFVGHTRYATNGKPEQMVNNHPIIHGNIVGVHNGRVHNYKEILKVTGREDEKALVDSEAIFAAVNKWGNVKGLSRLRTDAVTVHVDTRNPRQFFLARSVNRFVTIGWTTNGNLIFASEQTALEALWPLVKFTKFSRVSTNRLLTIKDGAISARRSIPFKPVDGPSGVTPVRTFLPSTQDERRKLLSDSPAPDFFSDRPAGVPARTLPSHSAPDDFEANDDWRLIEAYEGLAARREGRAKHRGKNLTKN